MIPLESQKGVPGRWNDDGSITVFLNNSDEITDQEIRALREFLRSAKIQSTEITHRLMGITPRPTMTSTGPSCPVAHFVCPDCGTVAKLPTSGEPGDRPWCHHGDGYAGWRPPTVDLSDEPKHRQWTQMEYAKVMIGEPHSNEEPWGEES